MSRSSITIDEVISDAPMNHRITTHPGAILREEFLSPLAMSARALAGAIRVPPNRVSEILKEERSVTADTAIRLGRFFGTTSEFWLNLQQAYDLSRAMSERALDYAGIAVRA